MPLPKELSEILVLSQKIDVLLDVVEKNLSCNANELARAKHEVSTILFEEFMIPKDQETSMHLLNFEYFREQYQKLDPQVNENVVKQVLDLFKKIKRIKIQLENITLSDSEVNKLIQSKFFKITSPYGEGTGYIINDEQGIILSSFHLVGAIKPLTIKKIPEFLSRDGIASVLHAAGLIDVELRLEKMALKINSKDDLVEKVKNIADENFRKITKQIVLCPTELKIIFNKPQNKTFALKTLKALQENKQLKFGYGNNDEYEKIAFALINSGHLNANFTATVKPIPEDLSNIVPNAKVFYLKAFPFESLEKNHFKNLFINNVDGVTDRVFAFIQRGKIEKEVVLLSDTVEIECDDEILIGEIQFPVGLKEDEEQRVLKNFAYLDAVPVKITRFKNGTVFPSKDKVMRTGKKIPPISEIEEEPMIGEKVYFGGYPLTQQVYTFSTGMLSAVTSSEARTCFVIEAPVAPGNSGSPVFIQRNGQIYWIGIINSEVAHVSEKMLEIQEKIKNHPEIFQAGAFSLVETNREITETLLANLCTGKGKAFKIPNIPDLLNPNLISQQHSLEIDLFLDFLVPKKPKNTVREQAKNETDARAKSKLADVFEYEGKKYYLGADDHNNKHMKLSKDISEKFASNRRLVKERWGTKPATFNLKYAKSYKEVLKEVVINVALNNDRTNFVRFNDFVGWDRGEETRIIELYYEEEGSHIRPKDESQVSEEDIIDIRDTANQLNPALSSRIRRLEGSERKSAAELPIPPGTQQPSVTQVLPSPVVLHAAVAPAPNEVPATREDELDQKKVREGAAASPV